MTPETWAYALTALAGATGVSALEVPFRIANSQGEGGSSPRLSDMS